MDDSRRRYANPMLNMMFTLFVPLELLGWDEAEVEPSWTFVYNWTIKLSSPSPLPPGCFLHQDSGYMDEASHSSERLASRAGLNRAGLPHHHHHRLHYSKTSVTPTSPYHRRRRHKLFKEQALAEDTPRRRMNGHPDLHRKSRLCTYDEAPPHNGKTYQLYTLYRDKDGNVKQAPANGCHCKPLIKRLEGELNATKEEMRTQMLTVQEQVYTRLGRMDRKSIHQIKVLDMLTQERVAAERMECLYRMDQRAAQSREQAQGRQVNPVM
ncbi:ankyrin repeat domain-containing protein 6-like [Salvelinus fontinalis]|uniref:ankyrin repeat domain-containing protein 6-like n=1 Tax=Salvelinus fontinalis TaxID=8038 RepID=UPI0024867F4A|nr:ankyrin repeat domain-containing protein 6-like [Salvelinus fontinalis]